MDRRAGVTSYRRQAEISGKVQELTKRWEGQTAMASPRPYRGCYTGSRRPGTSTTASFSEGHIMSCTVNIPTSPVFSPSQRPLSCRATSPLPDSVSISSSTSLSHLRSARKPLQCLRSQDPLHQICA